MCGRYALHSLVEEIQKHFGLFDEIRFRPRYNLAPSMMLPVARTDGGRHELALCGWGLVPHWARAAIKHKPINARAETVADKPFFRDAFRRRRCLVPVNGFYEWRRRGAHKVPYYFHLPGAELFALAGIWDRQEGDGGVRDTFAIITTAANEVMQPVHDRMPVVLAQADYDRWLDGGDAGLLRPFTGDMDCYPVSREVNDASRDGPALIKSMAGGAETSG